MSRLAPFVVLPLLAACAHAPPKMDAAAEVAWTMALEEYERGHLGRSMEQLAALERFPEARLLRSVTLNRPADVMDDPLPREARLLPYRAQAAWRAGDPAALQAAIEALIGTGGSDPELGAMAVLAQSAGEEGMRRLVDDDSVPAPFDPKLGVPIVDARLGGKAGRVILDSGAELSVVDVAAARRLGVSLPEGTGVKLQSNAGEAAGKLGLLRRLDVLGRRIEAVPVVLADLSALPADLGIVAILSTADLFSDTVLVFDYVAGQVHIEEESRAEGWPLFLVRGRAIGAVEGKLEGGPDGLFRVDTGGRRSVLTNEYVDAAVQGGAAWQVSEPAAVQVDAVGSARRSRRALAEGRFCPAAGGACMGLSAVPIDTTPADGLIPYAGKLGADAFAGARLELDYPAGRLRLLRGATASPPK